MAKKQILELLTKGDITSILTPEQFKKVELKISTKFENYIESEEFDKYLKETIEENLTYYISENMPNIVEDICIELDYDELSKVLMTKFLNFLK